MSDPLISPGAPLAGGLTGTDLPPADSAGGHHVTAMFATRAEADRAVSAIEDAGIARSSVSVVDQGAHGGTWQSGEPGGFWGSLKSLFWGDDDTAAYHEGVTRGQTLLTVLTRDDAEADRVAAVLEQYNPIDLDAQEEQWRSEGWNGRREPTFDPGYAAASPGASADPGASKRPLTSADSQLAMAGRAVGATSDDVASAMSGQATHTPSLGTAGAPRDAVAQGMSGARNSARSTSRVRAYTPASSVERETDPGISI